MPAAVAVPLIAGAIGGGAQVASGVMQSKANNKATKESSRAADKALAFETKQYEDEQRRLQPYRDMGGQAYQRMGTMLGLQPQAASTGFGGGMVKIRHPRTGEIREVPAAQAEAFKAKGGQVVA
jgi:hypothetical protein